MNTALTRNKAITPLPRVDNRFRWCSTGPREGRCNYQHAGAPQPSVSPIVLVSHEQLR